MWVLLQRLGLIMFTALTADQLLGTFSSNDIKVNSIYSLSDLAGLLNVKPKVIFQLIKAGDLKARKVKGKYMILGQNLKDFLSE